MARRRRVDPADEKSRGPAALSPEQVQRLAAKLAGEDPDHERRLRLFFAELVGGAGKLPPWQELNEPGLQLAFEVFGAVVHAARGMVKGSRHEAAASAALISKLDAGIRAASQRRFRFLVVFRECAELYRDWQPDQFRAATLLRVRARLECDRAFSKLKHADVLAELQADHGGKGYAAAARLSLSVGAFGDAQSANKRLALDGIIADRFKQAEKREAQVLGGERD